jgi:hypothetical protein
MALGDWFSVWPGRNISLYILRQLIFFAKNILRQLIESRKVAGFHLAKQANLFD